MSRQSIQQNRRKDLNRKEKCDMMAPVNLHRLRD
uniref:Uncharacterized protein n=1 Tax=Arundo donax TaxID=35708 RepID=A0A0A9CG52_ARUDO